MRNIRFRAWDNLNKTMVYDTYPKGLSSSDILARWENEWVMQFTGLNDKNGKEIYEGDLLQFADDKDAHYEVFYHDYEAKFSCARTHFHGNRAGGYIPPITSKMLHVVGNIYQNEELLASPTTGERKEEG